MIGAISCMGVTLKVNRIFSSLHDLQLLGSNLLLYQVLLLLGNRQNFPLAVILVGVTCVALWIH